MRKIPVLLLCISCLLCSGLLFSFPIVDICSAVQNPNTNGLLAWWSFDESNSRTPGDLAGGAEDSLYGNFEFVRGITGNGLKLDGFGAYAKRNAKKITLPAGAFTVEAWVALATYPWSWCPVAEQSHFPEEGFFFGINETGHLGLHLSAGETWQTPTSGNTIPLGKWVHIAGVYNPERGITLYINGKADSTIKINGKFTPAQNQDLLIGRNCQQKEWKEFQLYTKAIYFFLDGIVDELKIYDKALSPEEIAETCAQQQSSGKPELSDRSKLPTGPQGPGTFGAYYTKLDYYKEWDALWKVSETADVLVRFDETASRFIFWRGTSLVPCWVTENGIWYTNEWLETWGRDVKSCAEPLMDRQCKFSSVSIIENNDARTVIHWRYPLVDAFGTIAAVNTDGVGEWGDEFYTIYPDQVSVRKILLHYSKPLRKHDWLEQIIILPPGKYPSDVINPQELSLVNMQGEVKNYSFADDPPMALKEPLKANIEFINLKSKYKPFFIVSPDSFTSAEGAYSSPFFRIYNAKMGKGYRPDPVPSMYGWWNHWPVAQVPGDGRWVMIPDRPSHFNLTTFVQWKDYEMNDRTKTRIMLHGLTDKQPVELAALAKSWLDAPKLTVESGDFYSEGYDQSERAYVLDNRTGKEAAELKIRLSGSADNPIINPAFIIKNWGTQKVTLRINGAPVIAGGNFRQGQRRTLQGDDLIVWIKYESTREIDISLSTF